LRRAALAGAVAAPVRKNAAIVLRGVAHPSDRVKAALRYPPRAPIVDAGRSVLAGRIDAHIHSVDFFPPLSLS
jgi:hypothetical protein